MEYRVDLEAMGWVHQSVFVEADTPEEAAEKAKAEAQDSEWVNGSIDPSSMEGVAVPAGRTQATTA